MSSILTNNSAMVALQTLKSINMNLGKVQSEISTGKTVESAKDDAAVWAISKVMSSDVKGFEAISDSLSLGQATVGVALDASESITDLLTEIKGKVVNSQEENVDRAKIQTDIEALTNQIGSIAGAAQFNGLNLLSNSDTQTAGSGTVGVLSSLDRSASGVAASEISVAKQDLGTAAFVDTATPGTETAGATAVTALAAGATSAAVITVGATPAAGTTYVVNSAAGGTALANDIRFTVLEGDTQAAVTDKLVSYLNYAAAKSGVEDVVYSTTNTAGEIVLTNNSDAALANTTTTDVATVAYAAGQTAAGGLSLLSDFDVTTETGAAAALAGIEGLIQTSIDAAAALGSTGKRIETQADFVGKLTDNLKSGIGALVDADMEAASAKLQALQTQQQLGVQALSIANQAPQTILSLFR